MWFEEIQRLHLSYPEDAQLLLKLYRDKDWKMLSEGTTGSTWEKKIVPLIDIETFDKGDVVWHKIMKN